MLEPPEQLHPHLSRPRRPGWVRVDCHLHTCFSGDAVTTLDELAERLERMVLDVVCITDHNAVGGAQQMLERELGCRVVVGEEIRTAAGEVIGLFLSERVPYGIATQDAVERIHGQGGVVYVPHPFAPVRHALRGGVLEELWAVGAVDALEAFNPKVGDDRLNAEAHSLARRFGIPGGAGSDAHDPAAVGAAYVEMPDFDGPKEFLARLPEAEVVGHHFDRPRRFVPRVIPSGIRQT